MRSRSTTQRVSSDRLWNPSLLKLCWTWVSTTRLRGRTYLRAGVMNYLSTEDDIDRTVGEFARAAKPS